MTRIPVKLVTANYPHTPPIYTRETVNTSKSPPARRTDQACLARTVTEFESEWCKNCVKYEYTLLRLTLDVISSLTDKLYPLHYLCKAGYLHHT